MPAPSRRMWDQLGEPTRQAEETCRNSNRLEAKVRQTPAPPLSSSMGFPGLGCVFMWPANRLDLQAGRIKKRRGPGRARAAVTVQRLLL